MAIERDGVLTIIKVRDGFQDVAVGIERLRPTDPVTGGIPMGVQDNLGIDEIPRGDSLVQSLAKSSGSRHVWGCLSERLSLLAVFI